MNAREIKFRAWDKKRKKHYAVRHLLTEDTGKLWCKAWGYDCIEQERMEISIQPKDCIIEQYTGRKDKNGKDIYVGDVVVNSSGRICKVVYLNSPCFSGFDLTALNTKGSVRPVRLWEDWEIIGNIHEEEK